MKDISKEKFLEALSISKSKRQLMSNLGYKGGFKSYQIKYFENKFNVDISQVLNNNNIKHYKCKWCGKEFTEKYSKWSSGDFCSLECSHTFSSNQNKKSRIEKIKHYAKNISLQIKSEYYKNPKICPICGNVIPYEKKKFKTCSQECSKKLCSQTLKKKDVYSIGGYVPFSCRSHHGYYKGIYCDSTFELAYLIYCLDHNIDIKRCNEVFEYEYKGKKHHYHPDFIVNGEIIEIKNYYREINDIKLNAVNKPIKILYYDDLKPIFNYVAKTYDKKYNRHKNNFYELYEENH